MGWVLGFGSSVGGGVVIRDLGFVCWVGEWLYIPPALGAAVFSDFFSSSFLHLDINLPFLFVSYLYLDILLDIQKGVGHLSHSFIHSFHLYLHNY